MKITSFRILNLFLVALCIIYIDHVIVVNPLLAMNLDDLDFSQRVDWTHAGYPGDIPYSNLNVINIKVAGAIGDGLADDSSIIQSVINGASDPAVLFFPAGTYRIESRLNLKTGIVLRGAGYLESRLECMSANGCINVKGTSAGQYIPVMSGAEKGSTQITVSDVSGFTAGLGGQIKQDDIVTAEASWGEEAVGQMLDIVAINGNILTISPPLHINYTSDKNPAIRPINYVRRVGIEDLEIQRVDSGAAYGNNVDFRYVADSWIRRVESDWTEKYHIAVSESLHIEIRDSYIHDAKSRGSGGYGYGTSLARHATSILVENNIFYDLRHSMIVQIGTSGCVFGYNYAEKNYSDDDGGWAKTYISLHGHYPFMNLFEGNIIGYIGVGDYWGPIGPGNTLFRNRVLGTDRFDGFGDNHGILVGYIHGVQHIIGNEITGGNIFFNASSSHPDVNYPDEWEKVVLHGNNIKGSVVWDSNFSDHLLPDSFYLPSKPDFYNTMDWPSVGGDKPLGLGSIPALERFTSGLYIPPSAIASGDVDGNGTVELVDAILVLQVLTGTNPANIHPEADVNGDRLIGMEDALYIMQKAAVLQ